MFFGYSLEKIMSGMLSRLFAEGAAKAFKLPEFTNIYRIEFETAPGCLHSETMVWYEYSDECEQFSEGWFQTPREAQWALRSYVRNCL